MCIPLALSLAQIDIIIYVVLVYTIESFIVRFKMIHIHEQGTKIYIEVISMVISGP